MTHLDVTIPTLAASQAGVGDASAQMRGAIASAESDATAAQAYHMGESATAFQAGHIRFVSAAQQINQLLDIAQANMGDSASTYTAADAEMSENIGQTGGAF